MSLSKQDYVRLLTTYDKTLFASEVQRKTKKQLQRQVERKMATKLCRCIKKLEPRFGASSVGICTRSVVNRRGFTRGQFQCKPRTRITLKRKQRRR